MKTLILNKLRSGNYEIVSMKSNDTISFNSEKSFKEWFSKNCNGYTKYGASFGSRIIKKRYRLSQTYFTSAQEVINSLK